MSDRLLDDLIEGERAITVPPAGAQKRTWERVASSVAIGAPVPTAVSPGIASKLAASWVKGIVVLVLGGAVGVGAYELTSEPQVEPVAASVVTQAEDPQPDPTPTPAVHPASVPLDTIVDEVSADLPEEIGLPEAPQRSPPPAARRERRPSERRSTDRSGVVASRDLAEEARLVSDARSKLRGGKPRAAMQPLAEHARRFPTGQLAEERLALTARALCSRGDVDRGRREADALRAAFPRSSHLARVDRACDKTNPR